MPIFEFKCEKCGCEFEELAFGDNAPACPECASSETRKLMSACARRSRGGADGAPAASSGGCGSCMGGNCASCGR